MFSRKRSVKPVFGKRHKRYITCFGIWWNIAVSWGNNVLGIWGQQRPSSVRIRKVRTVPKIAVRFYGAIASIANIQYINKNANALVACSGWSGPFSVHICPEDPFPHFGVHNCHIGPLATRYICLFSRLFSRKLYGLITTQMIYWRADEKYLNNNQSK